MSNQFKPGDLALIVGCVSNPEDIGKVVELYQFVQPGEIYEVKKIILRNGAPRPVWICLSDDVVSALGIEGHVLVAPQHLVPLRGYFQPERQKSQEVPA